VPAIELVDGQKLVGMLENLELGLTPVKAFRITRAFFEDFKEPS
jgi:restriction system protein